MIDTMEQTTCKVCGDPIPQKAGKGHRKREFCSPRCKQADYRARHGVTNDVTIDQKNIAVYQKKLATCAARIEKLEHQVEVQRQRLGQSYQSTDAQNIKRIEQYAIDCSLAEGKAKGRIAELEQELAQYRQIAALMDRAKMEARFMELGEQVQYQTLTTLNILGGYSYWFDFMKRAKDEDLLKAIAAAEYYLEGLIALRGDPRERRIAELERQLQDLQVRLNVEERYRDDTQVRHFKSWLRRRRLPQDADFLKLFLDDSRLPHHASRSMYIARLKQYGYTSEDIAVFEEAWKDMLFNQS